MRSSEIKKLQALQENLAQAQPAYGELFSYIPQPHRGYGAEDVYLRPFFFGVLRRLEDGTWAIGALRYAADGLNAEPIPDTAGDGGSETDTMSVPVEPKPSGAQNGAWALVRIDASFNSYGVATFSATGANTRMLGSSLAVYGTEFVLGKLAAAFRADKLKSLDDVLGFFSDWKEPALEIRRLEAKLEKAGRVADEAKEALRSSRNEREADASERERLLSEHRRAVRELERTIESFERKNQSLEAQLHDLREKNAKLDSEIGELTRCNEELCAKVASLSDKAMRQNRESILGEVKRRKIKYFVHFTQVANLESILRNGLCTMESLHRRGISANVSDPSRYDENSDAICLSVSYPNYTMFYNKRKQDKDVKWCVILLKPEYVVERDPLFYETNAASSEVKGDFGDRRSYEAFLAMFDRASGGPKDDRYATDPQAEVQVLQDLPVESIYRVAFDDDTVYNRYDKLLRQAGSMGLSTKYNKGLFDFGKGVNIWESPQDGQR